MSEPMELDLHEPGFAQSLHAAIFRGAIVWFPMVGVTQLLGLVRWLAALPAETRPKAAINLFEPAGEWTDDNQTVQFYGTIWKGCPPDVKRNVALFSRTPVASKTDFASIVPNPLGDV